MADPEFQGLPDEDRRSILMSNDPEFAGLARPDQDDVLRSKLGPVIPGTEKTGLPGIAGTPATPGKPLQMPLPTKGIIGQSLARTMGAGKGEIEGRKRMEQVGPAGQPETFPVDPAAVQKLGRGAVRMVTGDGKGWYGGGRVQAANELIEGGLGVAASAPAMSMVAAPAKALLKAGAYGMASQQAAERGAEALGAEPETARLVGNIAGTVISGPPLRGKVRLRVPPPVPEAAPAPKSAPVPFDKNAVISESATGGRIAEPAPAMPEPVEAPAAAALSKWGKLAWAGAEHIPFGAGKGAQLVRQGKAIASAEPGWPRRKEIALSAAEHIPFGAGKAVQVGRQAVDIIGSLKKVAAPEPQVEAGVRLRVKPEPRAAPVWRAPGPTGFAPTPPEPVPPPPAPSTWRPGAPTGIAPPEPPPQGIPSGVGPSTWRGYTGPTPPPPAPPPEPRQMIPSGAAKRVTWGASGQTPETFTQFSPPVEPAMPPPLEAPRRTQVQPEIGVPRSTEPVVRPTGEAPETAGIRPELGKRLSPEAEAAAAAVFKPTEVSPATVPKGARGKVEGAPSTKTKKAAATSAEYADTMSRHWNVDPGDFPGAEKGAPWRVGGARGTERPTIRKFSADQIPALAEAEGITPEQARETLRKSGWMITAGANPEVPPAITPPVSASAPEKQSMMQRALQGVKRLISEEEGSMPRRSGQPAELPALMGKQAGVDVKGTGEQGKVLTHDFGAALDSSIYPEHRLERYSDEKARLDRAIELLSADARSSLLENESGKGWYTDLVRKMEAVLTRNRPEFQAPEKMSLFKYLLGITSNGVDPELNFGAANKGWDLYKRDGKFQAYDPTIPSEFAKPGEPDKGLGLTFRANSYEGAIARLNKLVETMGEAGAAEWLRTKHPVWELKQWYENVPLDASGDPNALRLGSYIFGEKVGAYGANLNGIHTELTADKWWSRSWNRWMGTVMATDSQGNPILDKEGLPTLQDEPRNEGERNLMRQAAAIVSEKLGIDVDDLQAVLWYAEQKLYRQYGIDASSVGYDTAAEKYFAKATTKPSGVGGKNRPVKGRGATAEPGTTEPSAPGGAATVRLRVAPPARAGRAGAGLTATEQAEYIPGLASQHLPGMAGEPAPKREVFTAGAAAPFRTSRGTDILHEAVGLKSQEGRPFQGAYKPAGGPVEFNPGRALPVPVKKQGLPAATQRALSGAAAFRGAVTGQEGATWNVGMPDVAGVSLRVQPKGGRATQPQMATAVTQFPDLIFADTGGPVNVINFGDALPDVQKTQLERIFNVKKHARTTNVSDYIDYAQEWARQPGSRAVTEKMFGYIDQMEPAQVAAMDKAVKRPMRRLEQFYGRTAQETGKPVREDLMNLLRIIGKDGLKGARKAMQSGAFLPALVGAVLLPATLSTQPEEPPPVE